MLYRKQTALEEDDIVLCKVTKIFPNSVFVDLLEYDKQGMIHISEVSPGRIRNIRDYVSVGRQLVCKVLQLDRKGHIDLSLRRVNSHQKQEKLGHIKQEMKAENFIKQISVREEVEFEELYKLVAPLILSKYEYVYQAFRELSTGVMTAKKLKLPEQYADAIVKACKEKFLPPRAILTGKIMMRTYHPDGVERVATTLQSIEKISKTVQVRYLGAGTYRFEIEDATIKAAEKQYASLETIMKKFQDKLSTYSIERGKAAMNE